MSDTRKAAALVVAECDRLDAALRDGDDKAITTSRALVHRLVDLSDAGQLRLFLSVVRLAAEATLRKQTDSGGQHV